MTTSDDERSRSEIHAEIMAMAVEPEIRRLGRQLGHRPDGETRITLIATGDPARTRFVAQFRLDGSMRRSGYSGFKITGAVTAVDGDRPKVTSAGTTHLYNVDGWLD